MQSALQRYAPPFVQWVENPANANLQILHMLDSRDLQQIRLPGRLVVIQHVTITCLDMQPPQLVQLWRRALLVARRGGAWGC